MSQFSRREMLYLMLSGLTTACTVKVPQSTQTATRSQDTLEIWWTKGLVLAEDEAIQTIVKNWQKAQQKTVNLSFHKQDDILNKLERAEQAGNAPDILYAYKGDLAMNPRWAWQGKLVDLTDILEPVKATYTSTALDAVSFYNQTTQKRSFYALPLSQEATYVFYLRNLVKQAGLDDQAIPKDWQSFWDFWKNVQAALSSKHPEIRSLGLPTAPGNSDTYTLFEHVLQAHNVSILDAQGKLQLDNPQVLQGIQQCLEWYAQLYQQGYIPATSTKWLTPDNNRALLNQQVVMTVNPSMSIPVSQQNNKQLYLETLGTTDFPNKLDGQPFENLVSINQAVILSSSQNQELAKLFLAYLAQSDVLQEFVKSSGGRFFPVQSEAWKDSFWNNPNDPHLRILVKTLRDRPTRLFYSAQAPAYSQVLQKSIWGNALNQIITQGMPTEQATQQAIQHIKEIFSAWQ